MLRGGEGNDFITIADSTFQRIDGGAGTDTLVLSGAGQALDFTVAGSQGFCGIEEIDLAGAAADVTLVNLSVQALSDTSNTVTFTGVAGTALNLSDKGWAITATGGGTRTLENGEATVIVDDAITLAVANNPPEVADDAFTGNEDIDITGDVLLDNGSGADGDMLTISATPVTDVANGTLVLNTNGTFTCTDSFVYTLHDGPGGSDTATVTLTVNSVNDDPVAAADAFTGNEDTDITGGVLADNGAGADADIDEDTLTVSATPVTDVAKGTLVLNMNGTFYLYAGCRI